MIKVIFFDVGGVLMDSEDKFYKIYEEFGKEVGLPPGKSEELHEKYLKKMLRGKMSSQDFYSMISRSFGIKGDLMKKWSDIAMRHITLNKEIMGIVDALRKERKVAILSNVTETREIVDRKLGVYEHFDKLFLSYDLKMKKPAKNIFYYALRAMRVTPEEALFIDDKEINLKVARSLGIKSIQFNNNAQLVTELKRLGLLG